MEDKGNDKYEDAYSLLHNITSCMESLYENSKS